MWQQMGWRYLIGKGKERRHVTSSSTSAAHLALRCEDSPLRAFVSSSPSPYLSSSSLCPPPPPPVDTILIATTVPYYRSAHDGQMTYTWWVVGPGMVKSTDSLKVRSSYPVNQGSEHEQLAMQTAANSERAQSPGQEANLEMVGRGDLTALTPFLSRILSGEAHLHFVLDQKGCSCRL